LPVKAVLEANRKSVWRAAIVAALVPLVVGPWAQAQRNGEAYSTVPTVERTDYDMRAFMAPVPLSEGESRGRKLFAQRCANCHGGTHQRPGPLLGQQTVTKLGDSSVREKVRKGSTAMPGFEHTLEPARIDEIIAFLKTYTPARREQGGAPE
jgi:mono/diheme cytochrome c family protein